MKCAIQLNAKPMPSPAKRLAHGSEIELRKEKSMILNAGAKVKTPRPNPKKSRSSWILQEASRCAKLCRSAAALDKAITEVRESIGITLEKIRAIKVARIKVSAAYQGRVSIWLIFFGAKYLE